MIFIKPENNTDKEANIVLYELLKELNNPEGSKWIKEYEQYNKLEKLLKLRKDKLIKISQKNS